MVWVPGGKSLIGSNRHYPEERPAYETEVEGFWMDISPVTNAQFAIFVEETGHTTGAEKPPAQADYPDVPPERLVEGSAVFVAPEGPVDLSRPTWWQYVPGADWRHPDGPDSTVAGLDHHPVVHIDYADAHAYAAWAGKQLPTEAQWEHAARGGLKGAAYPWGDLLTPHGHRMANYWHGTFPWDNQKPHRPAPTPAGAFPPNDYGLYDMCGSVWEWTVDVWEPSHSSAASHGQIQHPAQISANIKTAGQPTHQLRSNDHAETKDPTPDRQSPPCCMPTADALTSQHPIQNDAVLNPTVRVVKGGSFLCSENYCSRYRPAARFPQSSDTAANHLGFRCILTSEMPNALQPDPPPCYT